MAEEKGFELTLRLQEGYRFAVDFGGGLPELLVDEPAPLGAGVGPNAARLLGAAVGNCLAASLEFCLQRSRVPLHGMEVTVRGTIVRNEEGRFRIASVAVTLAPEVAPEDRERMQRCLDVFEDFCIVTQSVRNGLQVDVTVEPVSPAAV